MAAQLRVLNLNGNQLTAIDEGTLLHMPALRSLSIARNPMTLEAEQHAVTKLRSKITLIGVDDVCQFIFRGDVAGEIDGTGARSRISYS